MLETLKGWIDTFTAPQILFPLSIVFFVLFVRFREFFTRISVGVALGLAAVAFFAVGMTDANFRSIVVKPDNIPISMVLGLVGFFTWYAMRKAVQNDRAVALGQETFEAKEGRQKVLVWPDLVYNEFISLILCTAVLILWSIQFQAPLEQPANPADSPNPSKAPWYFLGLQEMLVYFDPWLAGVVLPGLIIVGLMAVPYFDPNPKGSGYYTFRERPFAITTFLFGFVILWVFLIMLGTFLRGPNWNFFGFFEKWDVHKVEPLTNVNLSEYVWLYGLGTMPDNPLLRELPGILATLAYLLVLPVILARTLFKKLLEQMGGARFGVMVFLLLMMASLPIKMILRWLFNLKYVIAFPEYFFNV